MKNILSNYKLEALRTKFIIIYLLNVTDVIFTLLLLRTGGFLEVNGIMRNIIDNEVMSIAIKIFVPLVLFILIYSYFAGQNHLQTLTNKHLCSLK